MDSPRGDGNDGTAVEICELPVMRMDSPRGDGNLAVRETPCFPSRRHENGFPERGRKLIHERNRCTVVNVMRMDSPRGDGNTLSVLPADSKAAVMRMDSPRGDGNNRGTVV